jgi:hypothetical protein
VQPCVGLLEFTGGQIWTVPELLFESKGLIPALQQLYTGAKMKDPKFSKFVVLVLSDFILDFLISHFFDHN